MIGHLNSIIISMRLTKFIFLLKEAYPNQINKFFIYILFNSSMKNLIKITLIYFYLGLVQTLTDCQLCMQTYKVNCTICYNRCNDTKDLLNCTYFQCNQTDVNNKCISYSNVTKNSTSCLGQCCAGFSSSTVFSEPNFNLCIEKDADIPNNINIGLTLGLVLALITLLFFAGLACLLAIIFFSNHQNSEKTDEMVKIPLGKNGQTPSSKPIKLVNMNQQYENYHVIDHSASQQWKSDGRKIAGQCFICGNGNINIYCNCGHQFHYRCLFFNIQYDQKCPTCHELGSLNLAKSYCSKCYISYRRFDISVQKLDINKIQDYENMRCPKCL